MLESDFQGSNNRNCGVYEHTTCYLRLLQEIIGKTLELIIVILISRSNKSEEM
jgi:hypothetical protein